MMNRAKTSAFLTAIGSLSAAACSLQSGNEVLQAAPNGALSSTRTAIVCGAVTARPDAPLSEMPVVLHDGTVRRLVSLGDDAFIKLLQLLNEGNEGNEGNKDICMEGTWSVEGITTIDNAQAVTAGGTRRIDAPTVRDNDYKIAQCVSPAQGGHTILSLVVEVKNNAITKIKAPALPSAPALSATYLGASSKNDKDQNDDIVEIEVSNGTIHLNPKRTITGIVLNLTDRTTEIGMSALGGSNANSGPLKTENCTFTNLALFKQLNAAK